jgi:hypothetical protein
MSHPSRLAILIPALAASAALLALLAALGCSPSLNRYQAKTILKDLPELKDVQKEIDFQDISGSGPDNAVVTAKVPVTFLLKKTKDEWHVDEIRLSDREWVKVEALRRALADERSLQTQFDMLELAKGLSAYYHAARGYPPAGDITALTDLLMPRYMPRLVRADAWGTSFFYKPLQDGARYQLASAGPDRKFRTDDDIVLLDGRIVYAATPDDASR